MQKKKTIILVTLLLLAIVQVGCYSASAYQKSLYNDDKAIVKQNDSYNFVKRISTNTNDKSSVKFKTFYGMETLWVINSEGSGKALIDYTSEINKGKFKCVLVNPNNEVIELFTNNSKGSTEIDLKEGTSRIKIVGNDTGGEFSITIKSEGDAVVKKSE